MKPDAQLLQRIATGVRTKPGMYFGAGGSAAIPVIIGNLVEAMLESIPQNYAGPLNVVHESSCRIAIEFSGLSSSIFKPRETEDWVEKIFASTNYSFSMVAGIVGFSDKFVIESGDGECKGTFTLCSQSGR